VLLSPASPASQHCCCNGSVSGKSAEITEQSSKLCGRAEAELVEQRLFQLPLSDCLESSVVSQALQC